MIVVGEHSKRDSRVIEYVITRAVSVFSVSLANLLKNSKRFISTEPRMSCYYLIYVHTDLTHQDIAQIFKRKRPLITREIHRHAEILGSRSLEDYIERFNELEASVNDFIKSLSKPKNQNK